MSFVYQSGIKLIFGTGVSDNIGEEAALYGKKAMVVTGGQSTKKSGLLDRCVAELTKSGLEVVVFDRVQQNPLTTTVMEGAQIVNETGCDLLVGLGGGSSIDSAKAIALAACNSGDITEYVLGKAPENGALPIIAVPTTCGTGTEGNGFAILTDPSSNNKKGLANKSIFPKVSIIDPLLMTTMPRKIAEAVIFDALCHCMEGYFSSVSNDMSRMFDIEGIKRIYKYGKAACEDPDNIEAWEAVTFASTLGGLSLASGASVAPHGIEHPLSGKYDIVHGRGLAAISANTYSMTIERKAGLDAFAEVSRLLGGKDENDFIDRLLNIQNELNMNVKLSEEGVKEEDIPWLVDNCLKNAKGNLAHHPTPLSGDDIAEIYRRSM